MPDDQQLYYEQELDYLRKSALQFAQTYRKVGRRLALEPNKTDDPHVARLLDAFAFLAAKIHMKMNDEFPEITEGILTVVYPQLVRPIPSMSVAEFQLDTERGKLTTRLDIKRDSPLSSKRVDGVECAFRTCYETTLWPLTVTAAQVRAPSALKPAIKTIEGSAAIRVELRCAKDITFVGLKVDKLRFYLDGQSGLVNLLYELLFSRLKRIIIRDLTPGSRLAQVELAASALRPVGFGKDEEMISYPASAFAGHRLLMEHFAFPQKFHFVDLCGLEAVATAGFKDAIEIIFLFSGTEEDQRIERLETELSATFFRLGCTPVVNLIREIAIPIMLDQRKLEYPIVPDTRRPYSMEVFSVDDVKAIDSSNAEIYSFEPFYSLRHSAHEKESERFWLARRRKSPRPDDNSLEVSLSLVDLSMATFKDPEATSVHVRITCTNGDLPSRMPFGNQACGLQMEGITAFRSIVLLTRPTNTLRPELGKSTLWRLVSHLSLNYLSIIDKDGEALREILRLYDIAPTPYSQNIIESIRHIDSEPHFARLASERGVSFARGLKIDMEIDEERFEGGSAFLFASVLERFLGMSTALNTFTQLSVINQRKETLYKWEPRSGRKALI